MHPTHRKEGETVSQLLICLNDMEFLQKTFDGLLKLIFLARLSKGRNLKGGSWGSEDLWLKLRPLLDCKGASSNVTTMSLFSLDIPNLSSNALAWLSIFKVLRFSLNGLKNHWRLNCPKAISHPHSTINNIFITTIIHKNHSMTIYLSLKVLKCESIIISSEMTLKFEAYNTSSYECFRIKTES